MQAILSVGNASNTPSSTKLVATACIARHQRVMFLDVVRRGARALRAGITADAADMHADRAASFHRSLIDRPVALAAEWLGGARRQQYLHEPFVAGAAGDFAARLPSGSSGLTRIEPRSRGSLSSQYADLPFIDGAGQCGAVLDVALGARAAQRDQDADFDAVEVKVLLAHEIEVSAGRRAGRRPCVAARDIRSHARVGQSFRQRLPREVGVGLRMLAPAIRQERLQLNRRAHLRMDIAIDHGKLCRLPRQRTILYRDIHGRISAKLPIAERCVSLLSVTINGMRLQVF